MELHIKSASEHELPLIAEMNAQLIEDEGSSNPMSREQLLQRAAEWHRSDWKFDLICTRERTVGYVLYRFQPHPFDPERQEVYLRQYFIQREERGKGYGEAGIQLLREHRFHGMKTVIVDVLEVNAAGRRFWEKVGFLPYYTNMRLEVSLP